MLGAAVAVAALLVLVRRIGANSDATLDALRGVGAIGTVAAGLGFVGFHLGSILSLRQLGLDHAAHVWTRAQLLKYLPVPASALAGFVGSAVQQGYGTRAALRALVLHTLALAFGAGVVSVGLLGSQWKRLPAPLWVAVAISLTGGLVVIARYVLGRPTTRPGVLALTTASWGSVAIGLGVGFGDGPSEWIAIGSAYTAAWLVGQAAVPVPAGLGVREAAFVLLLVPVTGEAEAVVLALGSRVLHAASDGLAALVVTAFGRTGPPASVKPDS